MKRFKFILKWLGISFALVISCLLLFNAWFVYRTGKQLEAKVAEMKAAGKPVRFMDLARKPVPAEENAMTYINRVMSDVKAMQKELYSSFPKGEHEKIPLSAEAKAKLESVVNAFPQIFPALEQASKCKIYDWQLDYTLPRSAFENEQFLTHYNDARAVLRVLRARTSLLAANGQYDEAIINSIMEFKLLKLQSQESLLTLYFVTSGYRSYAAVTASSVLQLGPVSGESRKLLEDELASINFPEEYCNTLSTEKAYVLTAIDEFPWAKSWFRRGFTNEGKLMAIQLIDHYSQNASRHFWDVTSDKKSEIAAPQKRQFYSVVVFDLLGPPIALSRLTMESSRASIRSLRVLNALQAKSVSADEVPKLSELGLPESETIDPFNGQPLIVKKLPEGWLVYSVGRNLADDGGKFDNREDDGVGPPASSNPPASTNKVEPEKMP